MGITDELRHEVANYPFRDNRDFALFEAIADRIDIAHKHAIGYVDDRDPETMAENGWVKLPVDADGEIIHVGDEMEGVNKYGSREKVIGRVITVNFEIDGSTDVAIRAWNSDGKTWYRAFLDPNASVYRHYHKPTVEDMLWELLGKITPSMEDKEAVPIVKAYAEKLQLADDGKEQ